MNNTISALLAAIAITAIASAALNLLIETTITQTSAAGGNDVLAAPRVTVESGRKAIIQIGELQYAVTPTLLDHGIVDVRAVLTARVSDKKPERLAAPRIKALLGEKAEVRIGKLAFATTTSLAK